MLIPEKLGDNVAYSSPIISSDKLQTNWPRCNLWTLLAKSYRNDVRLIQCKANLNSNGRESLRILVGDFQFVPPVID